MGDLLAPEHEGAHWLLTCARDTCSPRPITLSGFPSHAHLTIVLEERAQAHVHVVLEQSAVFSNEVFLRSGAMLSFLTSGMAERVRQKGSVESDASLHWQIVTDSASIVDHDVESTVRGVGGEHSITWAFLSSAAHRLAARMVFAAPNGHGAITMRGVAMGQARVECNGSIVIEENAKGTETKLQEHALLLDATAHVDAVPALEVRTNDVKAGHSASLHRIGPEEIFSFSARGIDVATARSMCIEGFLRSVAQGKDAATMRASIQRAIARLRP